VSGFGSSTVDGGVAFREWWMVHLVWFGIPQFANFSPPKQREWCAVPAAIFCFGMVLHDCPIAQLASVVSVRCGECVSFARISFLNAV
jgi:hypothetical protein